MDAKAVTVPMGHMDAHHDLVAIDLDAKEAWWMRSLGIFSFPIMGRRATCSRASITAPNENEFVDRGILTYDEVCSFDDEDTSFLRTGRAFPFEVVFRSFEASI
ncbi:unnamed protein product [Lactuca saligna]|uniref:Uncharacterized protein n=1 Tax=Lactuca saligna TaxID=75948 RepID=A0AA35VW54_LACSI|nr:unnamed protein product [Lactuca saligna]